MGVIDELFVKIGFKVDKKGIDEADKSVKGFLSSAKGIATAVGLAVISLDRMSTSLAKNNQELINFTRQTGLSIDNLNKVAGAGMLVDVNFSEEKAAQGLMELQSNLAQIRLGQGNIAPFQMLGISPVGKNATQIIEDLREAIKGVDDMTAVNLIQQMGLSPEFISLLRMTRQEYEEFSAISQQYMLTDQQRAVLQKYGIELKLVNQHMNNLKDRALIATLPYLTQFLRGFTAIVEVIAKGTKAIKGILEYIDKLPFGLAAVGLAALSLVAKFNPLIRTLTLLYLILEDLAVWAMGGDSIIGMGFNAYENTPFGRKPKRAGANEPGIKIPGVDSSKRVPERALMPTWVRFVGDVYKNITDMNSKNKDITNKIINYDSIPNSNGIKQTKNVTQNNYLSFAGSDDGSITNAISDLTFAYLQADRVV